MLRGTIATFLTAALLVAAACGKTERGFAGTGRGAPSASGGGEGGEGRAGSEGNETTGGSVGGIAGTGRGGGTDGLAGSGPVAAGAGEAGCAGEAGAGGFESGGTAGVGSPACVDGDASTSTCIDGSLVARCLCRGGVWDCIDSPEQACPGYCSDGSELDCELDPPSCEGGVLGIEDGCWTCARADSCRHLAAPGCRGDNDCEPSQYCEYCAHGSCPGCQDCVAECWSLRCPSEPVLDCELSRPGCGSPGVAVVQDGCWTCVGYYSCEPLTCDEVVGTCTEEPCADGFEVAPGVLGCAAGQQCCVRVESSYADDPPEMEWHEPTATDSGPFPDETSAAYAARNWAYCDSRARCCLELGERFNRNACLLDQASALRWLTVNVFSRGNATLDVTKAEECVRALAATGCDDGMPTACDEMYVGALGSGEPCAHDFECSGPPGSIASCTPIGSASGYWDACLVLPAADLGEPCTGSCLMWEHGWTCRDASGATCYVNRGTYCQDGTCRALPGAGESCYEALGSFDGCQPGSACIEGQCRARVPLGASCLDPDVGVTPCVEGAYCGGGVCRQLEGAGAPCQNHRECVSEQCDRGRCQPRLGPCGE